MTRYQVRRADCRASQRFSAALARVCQPGPVARSPSMTAASSRSVTWCLGDGDLGRPRRASVPPSYRSARSKNASVRTGASSGSVHVAPPELGFLDMSIPHRDNSSGIIARRPDQHHKTVLQIAGGDEPRLAIIPPVIPRRRMEPSEDDARISEIKPAMPQSERPLGQIKADLRRFIVVPIIGGVNAGGVT